MEVKEAAGEGRGNCLLSIPFPWDLPPLRSIHLLIVGAVIICNFPASRPPLIGSRAVIRPNLGCRDSLSCRDPSPAANSCRETSEPEQETGLWQSSLSAEKMDAEWWRSNFPGFGPGNLATPPPSTLKLSLSLSLHLSISVCKITRRGPVGWLGLEEIMSEDSNSLCDPGNFVSPLLALFPQL